MSSSSVGAAADADADVCRASSSETKTEKKGMSVEEFRIYNGLAARMDIFHNHFRSAWKMFEAACQSRGAPAGMSKNRFILHALTFCQRLTMHHGIEEQYLFPRLATRMPEFRAELGIPEEGESREGAAREGGRAELLTQHDVIHEGLEGFQAYLEACQYGDEELDWVVLRTKMEGWGTVLWEHLDQEVETLRAANMKKYWTEEEMMELSGI